MSLFTLQGTVTATGGATLHSDGSYHDWIEITGDDGRIFNVSSVFVGAEATRGLCAGVKGEFYFDKVFLLITPASVWKQLYGIKIEGGQAIYDPASLRAGAILGHIKIGLVLLIFVFGFIWLALAALQLAKAILTAGARRQAWETRIALPWCGDGKRFESRPARSRSPGHCAAQREWAPAECEVRTTPPRRAV